MKNFFIVLLMILIIAGTGYGVYYQIDSYNKEKETNNEADDNNVSDNNEKDSEEDITEELDINSELVQELYSYTNTACVNVRKFYYDNDKLLMSKIDNQNKIYLAESDMISGMYGEDTLTYTLEKFEESMKKIFGPNNSYTKESSRMFPMITFNENSTVTINFNAGCGVGRRYVNRAVAARRYNDRIEIDEKHIFITSDENENYLIFKEYTETYDNPIWTETGSSYASEATLIQVLTKYENSVPTYRFTYNKDEQGNYYLYSVELVK